MSDHSEFTYAQVTRLLLDLGFVDRSVKGSHRAFFHTDSDTWVSFSDHAVGEVAVRPVDLASVRKHLVEKGLLEEANFARRLREVHAKPKPSGK